jgi:hypothetical protein
MKRQLLAFACFMLIALPVAAQDNPPSWCPVTSAPVLEVVEPPSIQIVGESQIAVTYRENNDNLYTVVDAQDAESAILSDDARFLAYTRRIDDYNVEIWTANVLSNVSRLLVDAEDFAAMRPEENPVGYGVIQMAWIPGTHTVAFSGRAYYSEGIFEPNADDLWTVNAETGDISQMLAQGDGGILSFSPDDAYAVILRRNDLLLMRPDGSDQHIIPLENYQLVGAGHTSIYPPLRWESDSNGFIIALAASANPMGDQSNGMVEIWRVAVADQSATLIGSHQAFFFSFEIAPDLTKVAYWRTDRPSSNERTLFIADIAGQEAYPVITDALLDFGGWTNDSQHFQYRLRRDDGSELVLLGDVCGEIAVDTP